MAQKRKKALITGVTGQDGSYLAELLLEKGYEVHGLIRRTSTFNRQNIDHIFNTSGKRGAYLHYGDMTDVHSLVATLQKVKPDEIYNLAAQSFVAVSFEIPLYTAHSDAVGVLALLEAVRMVCPKARVYQASTSEMYSGDLDEALNESTPFKPKSPYGVAKLYGYHIARVYRESYGLFVVNGILFNHESPRRGMSFVSRKIALGVAAIAKGSQEPIRLGNLNAERDWGYAPEYMEAAVTMLQQKEPGDYVIATGESHSVREFVQEAFLCIGIEIEWKGKGVKEEGVDKKTGKALVTVDPKYFRPNEVPNLRGDASKAKRELGWKPVVTFKKLVQLMVNSELEQS